MVLRVTVLAAVLAVAFSSAQAATTDDIKLLMEQNRFKEAYDLGKANPDQFGDPVFDFFFGIAALDAGSPGEGVLALERYTLTFPDNRNARFNLARGYYILGEDQRARDEFEGLQAGAEGAEKVAIERYLDAIRARESRYQPTAGLWVEAGLGYDSNINSGVRDDHRVDIPGFGNVGVLSHNSTSIKESDWYYSYAAGVQGTLPVSPGVALYGSASFDARNYSQSNNDQFDQFNYGASGGVSFLSGKNLFRIGGAVSQQMVDGQNYLLTYGLNGEWAHQFDQFNRFTLGAFFGKQDFDNTAVYALKDKRDLGGKQNSCAKLRSADYWGASAGWTHVFGVMWQPVLSLSGGYTREENSGAGLDSVVCNPARYTGRPDYTRDLYNFRAQVSLTPAPRWGASLGASYLKSDYKGNYGLIPQGNARLDNNYGVDAMVSYRIDKAWSARVEALWNTQDSNVGLFDYSRTAIAAKVRYEFN